MRLHSLHTRPFFFGRATGGAETTGHRVPGSGFRLRFLAAWRLLGLPWSFLRVSTTAWHGLAHHDPTRGFSGSWLRPLHWSAAPSCSARHLVGLPAAGRPHRFLLLGAAHAHLPGPPWTETGRLSSFPVSLTMRLKLSPRAWSIVELRHRPQFGSINGCARILRRSLAALRYAAR